MQYFPSVDVADTKKQDTDNRGAEKRRNMTIFCRLSDADGNRSVKM